MHQITSVFVCLLSITQAPSQPLAPINSVIGDQGYLVKYGCLPDEGTRDSVRISAHLEYVEAWLRRTTPRDIHVLDPRSRMIALLREYRLAGRFPTNYDMPFRAPCFIDRDSTICAVGYLVEKTIGREFAEMINAHYQYDRILDMSSELLAAWVKSSGLTLAELAMIQPEYEPIQTPAYYASQRGESLSEFIAERVTLDPSSVDSVDVTCMIDTSGRVSFVRVIGREPLATEVKAAVKEARFAPSHMSGWMAGPWPNHQPWNASFRIVFNHPSDSVFVPSVINYKPEPRGTDAQPSEYAKIKLVITADSTTFNGYPHLVGGNVIVIERGKIMPVSFYNTAEFLVLRTNSDATFDVRIEASHYATLIVKGIPSQDAQLEFKLTYLGRPSSMPYYASMSMTRLAVWTR